jgi:sulfonate transport system ATP-binding protein
MDEPFSALDYFTRRNLQDMVLRLFHHQKKTILFVTHDVEEALLLGDRILVMENGNIKADMPVALPFPRKAANPPLQEMRQQILDLLAE